MKVVFYRLAAARWKSLLRKAVRIVLRGERRPKEGLSLVFVSAKDMRRLNRRYLFHDRPTDVLSFASQEPAYLGELFICLPQVRQNARLLRNPFQKELARVAIHGLLHLLGYNHERGGKGAKKMMEKQEKYLSGI